MYKGYLKREKLSHQEMKTEILKATAQLIKDGFMDLEGQTPLEYMIELSEALNHLNAIEMRQQYNTMCRL